MKIPITSKSAKGHLTARHNLKYTNEKSGVKRIIKVCKV